MPESRVGNGVRVSVKTQGAVSKNAFNNGYVITVQNVSGNNKYFIDGVQQDTLYLYRGNTYCRARDQKPAKGVLSVWFTRGIPFGEH